MLEINCKTGNMMKLCKIMSELQNEGRKEDYALLISEYVKHNVFMANGRRKNNNIDEKNFFS